MCMEPKKIIVRVTVISITIVSLFSLVGLCLYFYGKKHIPQMNLEMFVDIPNGSLMRIRFSCFVKPPHIKVLRFSEWRFCFSYGSSNIKRYYFAFVYEGEYVTERRTMPLKIVWRPFYKRYISFIEYKKYIAKHDE